MTASPTAPAPPARRFTRDDILRLGASGRAWEFLPVALQALRAAPQDGAIRLLAAANFAKIGLRTAALELLEALPAAAQAEETVASLRRAALGLPADEVPAEESEGVLRRNLAALAGRAAGVDPDAPPAAWAAKRRSEAWYRSNDGGIVRRERGSWEPGAWRGLGDHRGAAARFGERHLGEGQARENAYYLEGADPPWLLLEVAKRTPAGADGFQPRIRLVQADAMELLDGLAQADLTEVLGEERVSVYAGPEAGARLAADLRDRLDVQVRGARIPLIGVRTRVEPSLDAIVREAEAAQAAEHARLAQQAAEMYDGRDAAWWARRYAAAAEAAGRPLRVLVPTCRYTTYVQHAAGDLAAALEAAGCEARVLIEPDAHSKFSSVAYLRALVEFEPDLIVLVNYTRSWLGPWMPRTVPFVCWIQDAMPHQFDAAAGAAQGELDFLVGHVHPELRERFGYPEGRSLSFPVVASARKFHGGEVGPALRERYACEVALVSHHSEPPEALHARLVAEAGGDGRVRSLLGALRPRVEEALRNTMVHGPLNLLRHVSGVTAREVLGREPDAKLLTTLYRHYALPMADRILRHEAVAWAAEVAERRGWRLRLYGRGWERHERFGRYAAGEVEHGEALRACYRSAAAHLHVSVNTLVHQRVLECAMSGGLPIVRLTADALGSAAVRWRAETAAGADACACHVESRAAGYAVADHPSGMLLTRLRQLAGTPHAGMVWWNGPEPLASLELDPVWLLGDIAEVAFATADGLEAALLRAVENPGWRSAMSSWIARRARERLTHDALARRMIGLVRESLGGPAAAVSASRPPAGTPGGPAAPRA